MNFFIFEWLVWILNKNKNKIDKFLTWYIIEWTSCLLNLSWLTTTFTQNRTVYLFIVINNDVCWRWWSFSQRMRSMVSSGTDPVTHAGVPVWADQPQPKDKQEWDTDLTLCWTRQSKRPFVSLKRKNKKRRGQNTFLFFFEGKYLGSFQR